jgi:hypothetical protein
MNMQQPLNKRTGLSPAYALLCASFNNLNLYTHE